MNWPIRLLLAAMLVFVSMAQANAGRVYLPFRCTDSNGNPESGCRAYSFQSGTSTIYQLFSDAALTTPHGDYVTSDSSGYFPDSYAANDQCVKISFRESDGSTVIATMDDHCPSLSTSEISTALLTGTAAGETVGTSGDALCLLNTACTWSANQTYTSGFHLESTSDAATAGPTVQLSRDSPGPAVDDVIGEVTFDGKDDGGGDTEYGYVQGIIVDETDASEDGAVEIGAVLANTATDVLRVGSLDSSSPSTVGAAILIDDAPYYFSANSGTLYPQERCTPVETQTASTSASLDFETIPTGTTRYIVRFTGLVPATDDVELFIRVKVSGSFQSGATDYAWGTGTGSGTSDTSDSEIQIGDPDSGQSIGSTSGEFADGYLVIHDPLGTSLTKVIETNMNFVGADTQVRRYIGLGRYLTATSALQGIQLLMETGNITSGEATSYACFD